jgi:outer membrane protein TolC
MVASAAKAQDVEESLPPIPELDAVIERAIEHSPRLRGKQALVRKNRQLLERAQKTWMDNVTFGAQAMYGSYGNEVLNTTNLGLTTGVSIRLSLFDFTGRGNQIAAWEEEVAVSRSQEDEAVLEERQYVIDLYSRLTLARRLVVVRSEAWQAACAHQAMADAQFIQGDIPIAELARVTEIAAKAQSDYETARSDYANAYRKLEVVTGTPLASLVQAQ